jgi:hypothetical protein
MSVVVSHHSRSSSGSLGGGAHGQSIQYFEFLHGPKGIGQQFETIRVYAAVWAFEC